MMAADLIIEIMMNVVMLNVIPYFCVDAGILAREPLILNCLSTGS